MAKTSALAQGQPTEMNSQFARDVIAGLTTRPKRLSPKYFYDEIGSNLFERITDQPEYYPTRCEIEVLRSNGPAIGAILPERTALVEFGSGSTKKVRVLLEVVPSIATYVPVEISGDFLAQEAAQLRKDFPQLQVLPVAADFTQPFELPPEIAGQPKAGFFPGSTIGNFDPHEACALLRHAGEVLGDGAMLIIGVDLIKDTSVLNAAYNDAAAATAAFNLNLLTRMNRELGANFDLANFRHHAYFNPERKRVEMHIASLKKQRVRVAGEMIEFKIGETIHTECSYKYTVDSFRALARGSGWTPVQAWTDADGYFSVHILVRKGN